MNENYTRLQLNVLADGLGRHASVLVCQHCGCLVGNTVIHDKVCIAQDNE